MYFCGDCAIVYSFKHSPTRSVVAKLPDIEEDSCLQCTHVICFTETWLTPDQASPQLADHPVVVRSDCAKGGVMMSIHNVIQVHHVTKHSFSNILIEATTATLTLPNNDKLQVTLLYRSPSVPTSSLITVLSCILNQSSANMPTIVLGDFASLMSHHGFSQLVHSPSTDNGTLLDHVYFNRPSDHCKVQVIDAYYSDHDIVHCSFGL